MRAYLSSLIWSIAQNVNYCKGVFARNVFIFLRKFTDSEKTFPFRGRWQGESPDERGSLVPPAGDRLLGEGAVSFAD
jgi:hypothetical protein